MRLLNKFKNYEKSKFLHFCPIRILNFKRPKWFSIVEKGKKRVASLSSKTKKFSVSIKPDDLIFPKVASSATVNDLFDYDYKYDYKYIYTKRNICKKT